MQRGGNRRRPALAGIRKRPVFLLDRIRRRMRPRNWQTTKSVCQPGQLNLPILQAIGSCRMDAEVRDVTAECQKLSGPRKPIGGPVAQNSSYDT